MARKPKKKQQSLDSRRAFQLYRKGELEKALALYEQMNRQKPGDFDSSYMLGVVNHDLGRLAAARRWAERAAELKPKSAKVLLLLGQVLRDQADFEGAIVALEKALEVKPDYREACETLLSVLQRAGRLSQLVALGRKAVQRFGDSVEVHATLAGALEQTNDLDAARLAAQQALRLVPDHPRATFTLAKIERRAGDFRAAARRLRGLLAHRLPPQQEAAIAAELGEILDRSGDYQGAFQAFQRANGVMLSTVPQQIVHQNPVLGRIQAHRDLIMGQPGIKATTTKVGDSDDVPLFMVGFPRSGTTLSEQILTASGQVEPSDEEPVVTSVIQQLSETLGRPFRYPMDLPSLTEAELQAVRRNYWYWVGELHGPLANGRRFLDKLPLNIIDLDLIWHLFPSAPIFVILRDPRDCCLSGWMRQFVLNEAMVHFTSLPATGRFYAAVMGLWLEYRSRLPLHYLEVRYEDLVQDLEGTARKMLDFAAIPWTDEVLRFHERTKQRDITTPSYSAVASPIYRRAVARWRRYEQWLSPLLNEIDGFVKEFGYES